MKWPFRRTRDAQADAASPPATFNLLRSFSVTSMAIILLVALGLGLVSTRFVIGQSVERDALLTAQFVQSIAATEVRHAQIDDVPPMGELLDPRQDGKFPGIDPALRDKVRGEFFDHIAQLPDVLLANIYAPDKQVIWSTNPSLIGQYILGDDDLERAFEEKVPVSTSYHDIDDARMEQKFITPPDFIFIENYVPLFNATGDQVMAMVEIYKEPKDLIGRMERGLLLIWLATVAGGALIYLGLYWIVRRAAMLLAVQQQKLVTNETYVALGEMSSAVAHSLRNPLATIRSSAELALEFDSGVAHKNIGDIINQVDRMSSWVRELLQSLRPLSDEPEPVNLLACVHDSLLAFEQQIARAQARVVFEVQQAPLVVNQQVQVTQILNSLMANALEAMGKGGTLTITVASPDNRWVWLSLADTGKGMSAEQRALCFRPFFTTKQGGLGVGLVLVKRIMERFGGRVELQSQEGEGTCVSLGFRAVSG
ncbi:ATP-binding protein [Pseudomonas sp. App30]|uniref:sensor histidine kinase n=1 Tax=Pseudomonas sp. App30 TaxID=3068990 RepID=UPI003A80E402